MFLRRVKTLIGFESTTFLKFDLRRMGRPKDLIRIPQPFPKIPQMSSTIVKAKVIGAISSSSGMIRMPNVCRLELAAAIFF